ncbi:MAG: ABC transporter ATP-binding protein [Rhodospirillaceae bacterium]|nr:ABC transporter ATP-binding protein [Rhodospirillaceae bacterium]MCA8934103.1 ABC transporter ATP-binding protein [Rhodospirillaceae bacterium]
MVEVREISKSFDGVMAVDRASFTLAKGEFLTIVGPSGCGKTTILRMIAGFLQPTSGQIFLDGKPMAAVPAHERSIGMVFQRLALFPHMTAAQNIAYPLKMRRFDPAGIPDRVADYLKLVRLDGYGDRRPHQLSGGQQQRVAIARALSFNPDLLLLDEPLSALDRKLREEMQLEFRRIQQELGVTTINVTHDQREALVMSDRMVVMDAGEIQQADRPMAVYRAPSNRFVANFIGLTSVLQGRVAAPAAGDAPEVLRVTAGEATLLARGGPCPPGSAVDCCVRAEQIRIVDDEPAGEVFDNTVAGQVQQAIFEGERMVYEITVAGLGGASLFVFDHDPTHHTQHAPGSTVMLGWNARDLFAFPAPQSAAPAAATALTAEAS